MLNLTSELAQWAEVALRAIGASGVVTMTVVLLKLYRRWVEVQVMMGDGFAANKDEHFSMKLAQDEFRTELRQYRVELTELNRTVGKLQGKTGVNGGK